jgi:aminoglycoside phosphotransferase (APT) family kinase protein
MMMTSNACPDPGLDAFLAANGLARAGESAHWSTLTGGVSSDIWRVDLPGRSLCVKRALAKLKVSADWQAPVSRNAYEWAWMQFAVEHCPDNVPRPLAHDPDAGLFAMSFLDPAQHQVWKQQLMAGDVSCETARAVGRLLGRLHAASAGDPRLAKEFDTGDNFYALRIEPYLIATARFHPPVAARLTELAERTSAARIALVHGDVSPKNILVGPRGPVLLDAECAWFGDPAFDLAFCVNHLLLKCLVPRAPRSELMMAFAVLVDAYFEQANWESHSALDTRTAELLPALLLARVDGKSPVEYLTEEHQRAHLRSNALALLHRPANRLSAISELWLRSFS